MITILLITTVLVSGSLVGRYEFNLAEQSMKRNLMNVANTVAQNKTVQKGLENKEAKSIQAYVDDLLRVLDDVEIITVADMNSIRYGHPNIERLGEKFVGGDQDRVVGQGESYLSIATGTMGRSVRAFVPIYSNGKQVGFVMTAHMYNSVMAKQRQMEKNFSIYFFWGILIGSFGAYFISRDIKKSLLNLEPNEIVRLLRNQDAILESAREGILAIDSDERITLINQSAIEILKCQESEIIGRPILDVFPTTGLIRVLKSGEEEIGREKIIGETHILANRIPIYENGEIIGAMATILDRTAFVKKAEEVTGVRIIIDALRANSHEFRNKLHVLLGLLQLEKFEKAKEFIRNVKSENENLHRMVSSKIKNPTISALLLGKYNRAQEEGILLYLTEDSDLEAMVWCSDDDIIVVLGNLIENAIEAISKARQKDGEIQIYIKGDQDELVCQIIDNGPGIPENEINKVVKRGYSTKKGSSGIGLDLVKNVLKRYDGCLTLKSKDKEGTEAIAVFKRG
ncbi:ATP-binding protein [Fusibacter sp. JL216-2]|uniref:ATP-binding protein n=1 Tax=Fusibacter sp. JL216-2 TaxID=3071453 RepID=UPI003D35420E